MLGSVETLSYFDYHGIMNKSFEIEKGSSYGEFRRCCARYHISK